jgi:hypothetical protein
MPVDLRSTWLAVSRTRFGRRPHERLISAVELARRVETLDRPRWLYRPTRSVPRGDFTARAPHAPGAADLALAERLIAAYARATAGDAQRDGMWGTETFQHRHRALLAALNAHDARDLAETLASVFRSDIVLGMAAGSMGFEESSRLGRRLFWLGTVSKLTSLGEALGATAVENPEQGAVAVGLSGGLESLVDGIEAALGITIDFPDVGAAYGVLASGRLITPDTPDQIYGAARLLAAIGLHLPDAAATPPRVVEIGGGYGGMAYWFLRLRTAPYTIVDLPVVNVIQGYFLAQALGHDAVALYGEPAGAVTILPDHALADIPQPFDVLANKDSMPEIPREALLNYLAWARTGCSGLFYSYNQEARAVVDGAPQSVVSEALAQTGGFTRVRRDPSWLRRGYAEEIYLPTR